MNKKKQLAKNTIIIFFGRVCTQLISFFLLPLYTGYLSTKQYGLVDLIQTYVTLLVPVITLELEMSIFRYLIDSRSSDKDTKKLISNNFFVLGIGLFTFSILENKRLHLPNRTFYFHLPISLFKGETGKCFIKAINTLKN